MSMSTKGKLLMALVFSVFFGGYFVWLGLVRIVRSKDEPRRSEAVIWGTVGILIGLAVFAGITWLIVAPPPPEPVRTHEWLAP